LALDISSVMRSRGVTPGLYDEIQPLVQQVVGRYGSGHNLTKEDISRMTDEVMASSRRRGISSTGHGGSSLDEVVRLIILLNLFNYGYNINPFWYLYYGGIPIFILPFLGGGQMRPPRPRPPIRPVPPIGEVRPPIRPVPPIGEVRPPIRPVPPIGEVRPPIRPVPPTGEVRPPRPVPPHGRPPRPR
jgi:hypothetical protein